MAGWVVVELAEEGVAELLVERTGGEGVEPEADAGVFAGELLGLEHEGAAMALAAERLGYEKGFDEEPAIAGAGLEAAGGLAGFVAEDEGEVDGVGWAGKGEVVEEQRACDGGMVLWVGVFGLGDDGRQAGSGSEEGWAMSEASLTGLYAIVDADFLRGRGIAVREFAGGLRAAGVGVVQWRCKGGSPAEVLAGAAVLREVFAGTGCLLVMNDRVDLALLARFGGVHVGQGDLSVEDVRGVVATHSSRWSRDEWGTKGLGFVVGVSTHTEAEVRALGPTSQTRDVGHPDLFEGPDYVAVGPVFGTSTKLDAAAEVGLEGVRRARALTAKPLVAIGGITLANCAAVRGDGAAMCAVISGLVISGLLEEGRTVESVAREFIERLG